MRGSMAIAIPQSMCETVSSLIRHMQGNALRAQI